MLMIHHLRLINWEVTDHVSVCLEGFQGLKKRATLNNYKLLSTKVLYSLWMKTLVTVTRENILKMGGWMETTIQANHLSEPYSSNSFHFDLFLYGTFHNSPPMHLERLGPLLLHWYKMVHETRKMGRGKERKTEDNRGEEPRTPE